MDEAKALELYNFFSDEGYDVGDFEAFKGALNPNEENTMREELYNFFDAEGYDVGEFDNFFLSPQEDATALPLEDGSSELTTLQRNQLPTSPVVGEKDTLIERTFGKNPVTDFFGDLWRAGAQGQAQGDTVDDALSVFAAGKEVSDKDLQEYIQAVKTMEAYGPSDEMREFTEIYEKEGKGVLGFMKGVANNLSVIPQLFTSSVSAMLNKASLAAGGAGAATGGALGAAGTLGFGAIPGAIAGGIAGLSGTLETGLAYTEFLQEELNKKGLAFDDEGIRKILEDEDAMDKIQNRALGRGISIAAIDAVTGGLAAGVTRKAAMKTGKAVSGLAGTVTEGIGGAVGEAVARGVAGQEMDVAEIGFEGVAGTATAPLTVGSALFINPPSYTLNDGKATLKQVQTLLIKGTPEEIAGTDIGIKNNPELKALAEKKKQDVIVYQQLKNVFPDAPETVIEELIPLERKRRQLIDDPTKSAKNELIKVDEKIDEITNKYTEDADKIKSPVEETSEGQPKTVSEMAEGVPGELQQPTRKGKPPTKKTTIQPTEEIETDVEVSETEIKETPVRDYNEERFKLLSEEDKTLANRIKDEAKRNKFISQRTSKTAEGILIDEAEAAEKALADPASDEATLIAATRKIAEPDAPFNPAAISGVIRDLSAIDEAQKKGLGVPKYAKRTLKYRVQLQDSKSRFALEKQPNITQQRREARSARKNIKRGKLGSNPNITLLNQVFALDPTIIPDSQKKDYASLLKEVGEKKSVLTLSEAETLIPKAQNILNSVEESVDVKDDVKTTVETKEYDVKTEAAKVSKIKIKINPALDKDSKELAEKINNLTPKEIEGLAIKKKDGSTDIRSIKELELVKDNIEKGYVPKKAAQIMTEVESNRAAEKLETPFTNLKRPKILTNFRRVMYEVEKLISAPFGGIIAKNWMANRIRNNPKFSIDEILGNFNKKTIYNNTFRVLAKAFSKNETETKKLQSKIDAAYNLLAFDKSPTERAPNKIVKDQYKLRLYQLQREHLTNPGNKKTPSAMAFLNATLDAAIEGEVLSQNDVKILEELKKEFEVDGEIDNAKIEKSFNKSQKEALKLLDEVNNSLAPKALFTSAVIRGNKIDLLNNYSHHVILRDYNPSKDYFQQQQKKFVNPSTKAGTLVERTANAKPISFDPFLSATRGVQETLLDYHMTLPIRQLQQTLNKLERKIKENPKSTSEDIMAVKALRGAVNESLETVFQATFTDYGSSSTLLNKVRRLGYQAALASAPRAVAEFTSNLSFALASNPNAFMEGVDKYMPLIKNNEMGVNFLNRVGSTETNKIYNTEELTGKFADIGLFKQVSSKKGQAKSQISNMAHYLASVSGGKWFTSQVDKLANNILSAPDQWISRPLYFGEFARVFKQETGVQLSGKDMEQIAEGKSKYITEKKYKEAIDKSAMAADKQSVQMATSRNPFNTIDKLQLKPGDSARNAWRIANGYMANFSLFEFTTARAAINALFNAGEISQQQAVGLLTGVTTRMTLYMVIYSTITNRLDEAFGAPEDEDLDEIEEVGELTKRQLIGSLTSLLSRGTLGNIPNIPITLGIENVNEKYLQSLRDDEEFDPFKHALVFSAVGKKDLTKKSLADLVAQSFAGPYGPLYKTASRGKLLMDRATTGKTKKGREKAVDELTWRMSVEALGNLGLLPLYKDIRRIVNKKYFEDYGKKDTGEITKRELKKLNPKLYDKLYGKKSLDYKLKEAKKKANKKK